MSLYKLAIVGRPNVGKSLLFNRIIKKKVAIVHEMEGVTRDRICQRAFFKDKPFILMDTAGINFSKEFSIEEKSFFQTQIAIEEADIIVLVVDGSFGVTKLDIDIAKLLLKTKKRVILAINKVDIKTSEVKKFEFNSFAIKESLEISASQNFQIEDLLEKSFEGFVLEDNTENITKTKISIIGRTNVGKSTFFNALLNTERSIVSDMTATTRDSIDEDITYNNNVYTFIDTAGIRRKSKEKDLMEKFSHSRTLEVIDKSDICLLMIDANEFITFQEKKILNYILEKRKGLIILANKWDSVKNVRQEHFLKAMQEKIQNFPIIIISAITKRNLDKVFPVIEVVKENLNRYVPTTILNKFMQKCIKKYNPPAIQGKRLKIYYLTQTAQKPPKFLFFVNYPDLLIHTYKKYLINQFKKEFDFLGVQIEFDLKQKSKR